MDFVVLKIILTVLKSRSEFGRMRVAPMWISEGMKLIGIKNNSTVVTSSSFRNWMGVMGL